MDLKTCSYSFSTLSSLAILCLSLPSNNRFVNSRYSAAIVILKSFNLIDSKWYDILHHFVSFFLSSTYYVLTSNYYKLYSKELVEEYFIVSNPNISTIFLALRFFHKSTLLDSMFIVTFVYYRSIFVYTYMFYGFKSINLICFNSNSCMYVVNKGFQTLCLLNIYWFVLIVKKIKKMTNTYKSNTILRAKDE